LPLRKVSRTTKESYQEKKEEGATERGKSSPSYAQTKKRLFLRRRGGKGGGESFAEIRWEKVRHGAGDRFYDRGD